MALAGALDIEVDADGRTGFETSLGLGVAPGALSLGWSWDHVNPGGGPVKNRLNTGLGFRWTDYLASAVVVKDIAQTVGPRTWDLGVAVRPVDRMTISGVWRADAGRVGRCGSRRSRGRGAFRRIHDRGGASTARRAMICGCPRSWRSVSADCRWAGRSWDWGMMPAWWGRSVFSATVARRRSFPRVVPVLTLSGSLIPSPELTLFPPGLRRGAYVDVPLVLAELRRMPHVDGLLVKVGPLDIGWAKAAELRRGLRAFAAEGRPVHCVLSEASDIEVFVASGCGRIFMLAPVLWSANGLSAETIFLGEGLERLGVSVQVVRRGAYKSAPEQFTRKSMSPEQREALGAYLDDIYAVLVRALSEGRGLSDARVRELLDEGVRTASAAHSAGLVDEVLYPDEVEERLHRAYGRRVDFVPAFKVFRRARPRWSRPPRIAIIHVDAAIASGESSDLPFGLGRTAGATTILGALERVARDDTFVGAVLRVDSPGGDALASDLIARAVAKLNEEKPVVASLGDVAASGGYYVAAPARTIFAEDTTLTGSIGVFFASASFERLLERLGLHTSAETRGRVARAGSALADWTEAEREQAVRVVDRYYRLFLETVERGRGLDADRVRAAAAGRIWSGRSARARGLVDEVGGLAAAVQRAKAEAGLRATDPVELINLPDPRQGLADAVRYIARGDNPSAGALWPRAVRRVVRNWGTVLLEPGPRPVAMSPLVVDID